MWGLFFSILDWLSISPIPFIAGLIGTTPAALNLLLSILMGFPIAIIYHKYIINHKQWRHIFFILAGMDIGFYNFGITLLHSLIPAIVLYLTVIILGPGKNNAIFTAIFNMGYLLIGYIATESEDYDITWTMPHCVLTLKLIALSFDLWDGTKMMNGEELSSNSKKTAITDLPTLQELLGFVYFPASFLVGPICSFRRYRDFSTDKFPLEKEANVYQKLSIMKLGQGLLYLVAFQVGVSVFSMKYMQSDEFWEASIFYRHIYCGLWAHFALYKYISCWLLTEASCVRIGLSYNLERKGEQTTSNWHGCNNIKLITFEGATKFQHCIESFNCNTNYFAAEYIYKRLKFLGNRNLSQLFTLLFLALWHGTQTGYLVTFFNEFIIIIMEKELESIISKTVLYEKLWSSSAKYILYGLLKLYTIVFMGWSLAPFDLKTFSKWWPLYCSLYLSGFLIFIPWTFAYKPMLLKIMKYFKIDRVKTQ